MMVQPVVNPPNNPEKQQKRTNRPPIEKLSESKKLKLIVKRREDEEKLKLKNWKPITKLGTLVQKGKIKKIDEIFIHCLPIKEPEIVDFLMRNDLSAETIAVKSVQKQTRAGQKTKFMAVVAVGDRNGHLSIGVHASKEVNKAITAATTRAKLDITPIKLGYWGNPIGNPHTVNSRVTGKCGSVEVRLSPAPRGSGIVAGPTVKRLLELAGVDDCFTSTKGNTSTIVNVSRATVEALIKTNKVLTPIEWKYRSDEPTLFQKFSMEL